METLQGRLIGVLGKRFADLQDGLETVQETGRITGFVVSPDFVDMDDRERQQALWQTIKTALTGDEVTKVGPIVALTPSEATIDVSMD